VGSLSACGTNATLYQYCICLPRYKPRYLLACSASNASLYQTHLSSCRPWHANIHWFLAMFLSVLLFCCCTKPLSLLAWQIRVAVKILMLQHVYVTSFDIAAAFKGLSTEYMCSPCLRGQQDLASLQG